MGTFPSHFARSASSGGATIRYLLSGSRTQSRSDGATAGSVAWAFDVPLLLMREHANLRGPPGRPMTSLPLPA